MSYHSKYDRFWLKNINIIRDVIRTAYINGSASIDISEISKYGKRRRDSWYGKIVICRDKIVKDSVMVHLKSLGRLILSNSLLIEYDSCFSFTVTKVLRLLVKKLNDIVFIEPSAFVKKSNRITYGTLSISKSSSSNNLFRNKPLGPECKCDYIFEGFYWHELPTLKASQLPGRPGVYVIRVIERGGDLINTKLKLEEIVYQTNWDELIKYVTSRLVRVLRIRYCSLIYIGSTDNIKLRFKDLAGRRHTAFFPILALLLNKWKLDYGFKIVSTKKEAERLEEELKKKYQKIHGFLPALVEV